MLYLRSYISKFMKPVILHLRSTIFKLSAYLDDIFICAESSDILKSHVNIVVNFLNDLGFRINFEKLSIEPSHTILQLGYIWNSSHMSISRPSEK